MLFTMKKLFLLLLLELTLINAAFCSLVDTTTAKTVANNFFVSRIAQSSQPSLRSISTQNIDLVLVHQEVDDYAFVNSQGIKEPYYYVYNINDTKGFIIVSADDNVTPILGYSYEGTFHIDNQPPAFVEWMNNWKNKINYYKTHNVAKLRSIGSEWNKFLINESSVNENSLSEVAPMIKVTWSQGKYYNEKCPEDNQSTCPDEGKPNPDGHVYTGCTATAMGQLMTRWSWPQIGYGSHTDTKPFKGNYLTEYFGSYNWSLMPKFVSDYNTDMATLLYHAGVASNTEYTACSSGANSEDTRDALVDHFRYSTDASVIYRSDSQSSATWESLLIDELQNGRPFLYRGESASVGHIFVCDGYNGASGNNYFHFNWGWNGYGNGFYYLLDNLLPLFDDSTPISQDFNEKQAAIINISPNSSDLITLNQSLSTYSSQAGSTIVAYCAEKNNGCISAGSNVISIHLSSDTVLTPGKNGDEFIGEIAIPSVPKFTTSNVYSENIIIPSSIKVGIYNVFFSADGMEKIPEYDENNNRVTKQITITASGTIRNPPLNLTTTTGDGRVTLNWSVPTSGTPTSYNVYISPSQNGSYTSYNTTSTIKTFSGLTNGSTYWFYVIAVYATGNSDPTTKISATPTTALTNDDCSNATLLISSTSFNYLENQTVNNATSSGKPKASCDVFTGTPSLADVWYFFKATATTHTISVDPNGSQLDAVIAVYSSCSSNTELGSRDITGSNGVFSYLTLTNLTIGNYYYIRVYDYGLQTTDGGFRICVTGENNISGDDFYIQNEEVSATTVEAGGTIDVSASQCYSGSTLDTEIGTAYLGYYLSTNSIFSKSSDIFLDESPSGLGSDDPCNSESETLKIPIDTDPGSYFLLFVADHDDDFDEIDESNNVRYIKINVTKGSGLPDLALSYSSYTPEITSPGTTVHVDFKRYNWGVTKAEQQTISVFISNDKEFVRNEDLLLEELLKGTLDPDEESTSSMSFRLPDCYTCGTYYIFLVIDCNDSIAEIDENNNSDYFQIPITNCTECTYMIPPTGSNFLSAGGTGNFTVSTTKCCEWSASTADNFITILNGTGKGNGVVTYSVEPCGDGSNRTGTITVAGSTHTISQNCQQVCNNSQTFEWAAQAGSTTLGDGAKDLAIDVSGNLIMTGKIHGAASFGEGLTLTSPSNSPDIFVSKHNSSGQIVWAVGYGDTDQEYGTGVSTDKAGNIYVIGNSTNGLTFGSTTLSANGTNDGIAFLIKLNPDGVLQWAKKINPLYYGESSDILIDNSNTILITGTLSDYSTGIEQGFYIAKYNTSGTQLSYKTFGFSNNILQAMGIAIDYAGCILITGKFEQSLTLGSTNLKTDYSFVDIEGFIAKFDVNCNPIWAKQLGSPDRSSNEFTSIAIDKNNNVYAIGSVDSTAIIGNISMPQSDKKRKTIFVKYDPNGNPIWAKTSLNGYQYNQQRIIFGVDDNLYFVGCFSGALELDSFIIVGNGENDLYMGCMNTDGDILWLKGLGGPETESVGGIVANNSNDIFISGDFENTVLFGNSYHTSAGRADIFLAKFKQCDPPVANIIYSGPLTITDNETKSFSTEYCSSYNYQWQHDNVNIFNATLPTYNASLGGAYNVIVKSFTGCETKSNAVILSKITNVPQSNVREEVISIFPNPTTNSINIVGRNLMNEKVSITLTNTLGQLLSRKSIEVINNLLEMEFRMEDLSSGIYFIEFASSHTKKVILVKKQ